jgi:uncharacterized protein
MKIKRLTFLLAFKFMFFFSSTSLVFGDDVQNGMSVSERNFFRSILRSAEEGKPNAQFLLGGYYDDGNVIPQDYKKALKWYRLSAEQGDKAAQFSLGVMHERGKGVLQDHKKALKWYRLSAEQENEVAQFNLGVMYYHGRGVPQNYMLSHMWWNLSGSNGDKEGIKYRDKLEKRMTKQQIEKAQEMAKNWKPKTK